MQITDLDTLSIQEWNVCPMTQISTEAMKFTQMCEFSVLHIHESFSVCDEDSSLLGSLTNKFQDLNLQQILL
jgi:hypothetical protein